MDPRRPANGGYQNQNYPPSGQPNYQSSQYPPLGQSQNSYGGRNGYPSTSGSNSPHPGYQSQGHDPRAQRGSSSIQAPTPSYPSDPRRQQNQDPRNAWSQQVSTPTPPPVSSTSTPIPRNAGGTVAVAEPSGDVEMASGSTDSRAKKRPLFCVVCASNNVRPNSTYPLEGDADVSESINGSPYGLRVSNTSSLL